MVNAFPKIDHGTDQVAARYGHGENVYPLL